MVDGERADRRFERRDCVERNECAAARADIQQRQCRRIGLIARLELHHHPILVVWRIYRRDLARAVRVIQRAFDRLRRNAQRGGLVAIDIDGDLRLRDLQIARHVDQILQRLELRFDLRRKLVELLGVGPLQRVLVLCAAHPAAHAQILNRLEHDRRVGKAREFVA